MKKQSFITILLTVLMSMVGTKSFAYDIAVPNSDGVTIYYDWINNNTELAVSYRGSNYYYSNSYSGDVVIPESVEYNGKNYTVTRIGVCAFSGCQNLTSITIPRTVTGLGGEDTFEGCTSLTSVHITDLEVWCKIDFYYGGNPLEYAHHLFLNDTEVKDLIIPDGVSRIGNMAFRGCNALTSVTIPASVTSIGNKSFLECSGLTSITVNAENTTYDSRNNCNAIIEKNTNTLILGCNNTIIPNSVTSIGEWAFYRCSGLTSIEIPNSVTTIGNYAFYECSGMSSAIIGSNVTSIGNVAFSGCSSLTSIVIPKNVESIGVSSFRGCNILASISVEVGNTKYDSRNNCNAIIETQSNKIIKGCKNSTIPNSVTRIGDGAFSGCIDLKSIEIPNSVTSIESGAFSGCSGLKSIEIPNSVTSIESYAFSDCSGLKSIEIPNSVTNIGEWAFYNCSNLTSIEIPNSVTSLGRESFSGTAWYNNQLNGMLYLGNIAYKYKGTIPSNTSITIKEGIQTIADGAFNDCSNLIFVNIPNSVKTIGNFAFSCTGLTSIEIPNSVTSIGAQAFWGCTRLSYVSIGKSVRSIGSNAFNSCISLTSVTIPNSLTNIGDCAFLACTKLTKIISEINNPYVISDDVFNGGSDKDIFATVTLIVPPGKKSAYQNTAGWKKFQNIIEAGGIDYEFEADGIRYKIGENNTISVIQKIPCYSGDIVIPAHVVFYDVNYTVTTIGPSAFANYCTELTSVTIPPTVTTIENGAFFDYLDNLKAVHIMDLKAWCNICISADFSDTNPLYSAQHLYLNGEEIKDLVIPSEVTSINNAVFYGCSGLTSITIPNSVINIGEYAFANCSGLASIVSDIVNPFDINENVFKCYDKKIYASATLIVPPGKKSAYQNTEGWKKFTNIVEAELIGYEFESDGIRYKIGEDNTVSVVPRDSKYTGDVMIPSQVAYNGVYYSVTHIGFRAFADCSSLTSITIPPSITRILEDAFRGCTNLSSVYISDLNAWLKVHVYDGSHNGGVDYSCSPLYYAHHLYLNGEEVKSIEIPNTWTYIPSCYFENWDFLTSVTIPNSITRIDEMAFDGCSGLTSITIPNSVTKIYDYAFYGCKSLTEIVTEIENPFAIVDHVFGVDIYATATLIVPPGKKSAYQNTAGWNKFKNIVEAGGAGQEFMAGGIRFKIGESNTVSVTSGDVKYTGEITIPRQVEYDGATYTVTSIGSSAFEGCVEMTSVSIPNSVIKIDDAAFYYCTGLKTIEIPEGVKTIGEGAFSKCGNLVSVTIPGTVTSIGKNAFFQCYGLTQITSYIESPFAIDNGVFPTSVYENASLLVPFGKKSAYQNTSGWKRFQNINEGYINGQVIESDGIYYKIGDNNTVSVTSGEPKYIGDIWIPQQVEFEGTTYYVTGIEPYAFENCTGLTSVNIPDGVTIIEGVFNGCINLTDITLPNSLLTIGDYTFAACSSLTSMTIPNDVTTVGASAFKGCSNLINVTIGNSVASIGNYAFDGCSALSSVTIPNSVASLGSYAFRDCSSLSTATISDNLTSLEYRTFSGCKSLSSVNIPDGVTSIGGYAFSECSSLPTITIPNSVTSIGQRAFYQCTGLESIVSEIASPFAIDENVFESSQTKIYTDATLFVPEGTIDNYKATEGWNKFVIIEEQGSSSAIDSPIIGKQNDVKAIYSIRGERLEHLSKGINIIMLNDGTIKKMVIK